MSHVTEAEQKLGGIIKPNRQQTKRGSTAGSAGTVAAAVTVSAFQVVTGCLISRSPRSSRPQYGTTNKPRCVRPPAYAAALLLAAAAVAVVCEVTDAWRQRH